MDNIRNWLQKYGLIILGAVIGFVLGWALGAGLGEGFFVGILLVITGAIIGFVVEWYIDEAHRKNPDQIQISVTATAPEGSTTQPASEASILASLLEDREADLSELREKLATTELELAQCQMGQQALQEELTTAIAETVDPSIELAEPHTPDTSFHDALQERLETTQKELAEYRVRFEKVFAELQQLRELKEEAGELIDDLTEIKGIGKVYQQKLYNIGIKTYRKLSQADPEDLRRKLEVGPWQSANVASWVTQALEWVHRLT